MDTINILIADDHKIFRDGIRALLKGAKGFKIIGEAKDGEELVKMVKDNSSADVILMDIKMPKLGGIEATEFLKGKYPDIKILAFSMYDEEQYIMKMLQAGALGYILKSSGKDELITAIKTLANGDSYFSKEVSAKIFAQFGKQQQPQPKLQTDSGIPLTDREVEILKLIAEELTNQEIADKLYISPRTVDTHRRNLLQKIGVKNTAGLVKYAIKKDLLD